MTCAPNKVKIKKGTSLGQAFWQIGSLTLVSRVIGFIRDIAFASFLGAGPAADAFLVALKLPNMFRRLTAEGAMTNAFLPSFAKLRTTDGRVAALGLPRSADNVDPCPVYRCHLVRNFYATNPFVVCPRFCGNAGSPCRRSKFGAGDYALSTDDFCRCVMGFDC